MIPTLQKGQVGRYILRKPYSVVLLMQFDDQADGSTTVTDQVGHTTSLYHVPGWTAEIATVSTTSPLMGAGSLVCHPYAETGSFSNIIAKIDSSTDFDLPGDFTIEFSINGPSSTTTPQYLFARGSQDGYNYTGGAYLRMVWYFEVHSGAVAFVDAVNSVSVTPASGGYTSGSLMQYAVTREGTTLRLYVNGVLKDSDSGSVNPISFSGGSGTGNISVGGPYQTYSPLPNSWFSGKYDNIRITKGLARYTGATYTPSTDPFTYPDP
jgi:hypothetical protein